MGGKGVEVAVLIVDTGIDTADSEDELSDETMLLRADAPRFGTAGREVLADGSTMGDPVEIGKTSLEPKEEAEPRGPLEADPEGSGGLEESVG